MSSTRAAVLAAARHTLLLLLLTLPVWAPLTRPGLPTWQVGPLPVLNVHAVERGDAPSLAAAPERWRGAGLATYPIAGLARAWDASAAVKLSALLAVLLLALGVFAWGRQDAGHRAGVLAATLVMYAPVFLSALYRAGELAALWTAAGLALAGFGVASGRRWGAALAGLGALLAITATPGLGLWAAGAALVLALFTRQWIPAIATLTGAALGVLLVAPWSRPVAAVSQAPGVGLNQLIEPGWRWDLSALGWEAEPSASLGLALLALLILAVWAVMSADAPRAEKKTDRTAWIATAVLGALLAFFSLDAVASHLHILQATVADPRQMLLLAVPFLAVAAGSVLHFIPALRRKPLWAALLIMAVLNAGPALSPVFVNAAIPAQPAAVFGDNQIMLLDLRPQGTLEPGGDVRLQADWLALETPDFDYNIFVHVVDEAGNTVAQLDVQPQAGARPMTSWRPGEPIADTYELAIPADAPTPLRIRLGLYNWQTLDRLSMEDSDAYELRY